MKLSHNPQAIEMFFPAGRDMLNMSVKIDEVVLHRWDGPKTVIPGEKPDMTELQNNDGCHVRMTLNKDNSTTAQPTTDVSLKYEGWSSWAIPPSFGAGGSLASRSVDLPYPYIKQIDVADWSELCVMDGYLQAYTHGSGWAKAKGFNQYSYLLQRNYDFAGSSIVPNEYRLACFAYNYYVDDDVALRSGDSYFVSVKIRDRSQRILNVIINELNDIYEEYEIYASQAAENCVHNMFDDQFNQFFIDKMNEQYGEQPDEAPWQKMAVAVTIIDDLLYARYAGEISVIFVAANSISDSVNPYSGNLYQVNFWLDYFAHSMEQLNLLKARIREDHYDQVGAGYVQKATSEYKYYKMGNKYDDYDSSRKDMHIMQSIIDYASDRTDEFPELPSIEVGQDQDSGTY